MCLSFLGVRVCHAMPCHVVPVHSCIRFYLCICACELLLIQKVLISRNSDSNYIIYINPCVYVWGSAKGRLSLCVAVHIQWLTGPFLSVSLLRLSVNIRTITQKIAFIEYFASILLLFHRRVFFCCCFHNSFLCVVAIRFEIVYFIVCKRKQWWKQQ